MFHTLDPTFNVFPLPPTSCTGYKSPPNRFIENATVLHFAGQYAGAAPNGRIVPCAFEHVRQNMTELAHSLHNHPRIQIRKRDGRSRFVAITVLGEQTKRNAATPY